LAIFSGRGEIPHRRYMSLISSVTHEPASAKDFARNPWV
jgi:hypothetical protein